MERLGSVDKERETKFARVFLPPRVKKTRGGGGEIGGESATFAPRPFVTTARKLSSFCTI